MGFRGWADEDFDPSSLRFIPLTIPNALPSVGCDDTLQDCHKHLADHSQESIHIPFWSGTVGSLG